LRPAGESGIISRSRNDENRREPGRALVPAGLIAGLFAVRTALEDRCLRAELPGYGEYASVTRSKLIPGLW
jgi:protein-S-isoprenylcysteine O-methyltransferase Ste14